MNEEEIREKLMEDRTKKAANFIALALLKTPIPETVVGIDLFLHYDDGELLAIKIERA